MAQARQTSNPAAQQDVSRAVPAIGPVITVPDSRKAYESKNERTGKAEKSVELARVRVPGSVRMGETEHTITIIGRVWLRQTEGETSPTPEVRWPSGGGRFGLNPTLVADDAVRALFVETVENAIFAWPSLDKHVDACCMLLNGQKAAKPTTDGETTGPGKLAARIASRLVTASGEVVSQKATDGSKTA